MRILHIITSLNIGGAELMLKRLIESHRTKTNSTHTVISLTGIGEVGMQLRASGVEVQALNMRSPLDILRILWRLRQQIRSFHFDIVQTWMYHANLLGGLAARFAGNYNVIWGIRGSAIPQQGVSATSIIVSLGAWLSRILPSVIICCAESARIVHVKKGYKQSKMIVVPNGFDLTQFIRTPLYRQQARTEFGFDDKDIVVGIVGRFDLLKDYRNFVLAGTELAKENEHVKYLMVGRGIERTNEVLMKWIEEGQLVHKFILLGERNDIPRCLASMDIFCLSSSNEGFPNVVCEAMAMGVPCVVTDAGDAAEIVSDTGIVVAPCDPTALARALRDMISKGANERLHLGELARQRINKHYSIDAISSQFDNIYKKVTKR